MVVEVMLKHSRRRPSLYSRAQKYVERGTHSVLLEYPSPGSSTELVGGSLMRVSFVAFMVVKRSFSFKVQFFLAFLFSRQGPLGRTVHA